MSLKHNPFDQTPKGNLVKRRKVFESPTPAEAIPETEQIMQETNLQRVSRDNLEKSELLSRDVTDSKSISRAYRVINRESLQRVSRDNLEKSELNLNKIVGLQRRVLFSIFHILQSHGVRVSPPIAIGLLAERVNTTIANTQNAIKELIKKKVLIRKDFQRGRGGWTIYEIESDTFSKLDSEKIRDSLENLQRVSSIQMGAKSRETPSSSSRDLNNKETTTTGTVDFELSVDVVVEFGLTASAITRCFELYPSIDREKMQDLINRFGQFMKTGDGKRVQNARGFFISLAEQLSKGITPLDHIETSEARLMRELVEKKRAQRAEIEQLEKEMRDFDFEEWWEELAPADRDAHVKPNGVSPSGSQSQKIMAKQVHAEKFWPDRKKQALSAAATDV